MYELIWESKLLFKKGEIKAGSWFMYIIEEEDGDQRWNEGALIAWAQI